MLLQKSETVLLAHEGALNTSRRAVKGSLQEGWSLTDIKPHQQLMFTLIVPCHDPFRVLSPKTPCCFCEEKKLKTEQLKI